MSRSTSTVDSYHLTTPPFEAAVIVVTLLAIGILAGNVGNFGGSFHLGRRRNLRKVPHFLLGSLSLTGLISSLITMPATLAMAIVTYFPSQHWQVSPLEIICRNGFSSSLGLTVINALTLSLMAIDRQDCVIRPLKRRLSPTNVKKVIFVIWKIGLLLAFLHGVMLSKVETSVCSRLDPYNSVTNSPRSQAVVVYTMAVGTIPNVLTVIVITITLFRVAEKLHSSTLPRWGSFQRRRENKLTIRLM